MGELPTTAASWALGCIGFMNAAFGLRFAAFFAGRFFAAAGRLAAFFFAAFLAFFLARAIERISGEVSTNIPVMRVQSIRPLDRRKGYERDRRQPILSNRSVELREALRDWRRSRDDFPM